MGDMADWIIEQGWEDLDAHRRGECDYGCRECHDAVERDRKREAKKAKRKKPAKRKVKR